MLYQKLIKLLNEKKFFEIEEIYQNNKTSIDKNEDLLAIYGTALFNQNKYESALSVFRKAYIKHEIYMSIILYHMNNDYQYVLIYFRQYMYV